MSEKDKIKREDLKRVLVLSSRYKPAGQDVARAIVTWLERAGVEVIEDIEGEANLEETARDADFAIAFWVCIC